MMKIYMISKEPSAHPVMTERAMQERLRQRHNEMRCHYGDNNRHSLSKKHS